MALTNKHVADVCYYDGGKHCCRYLGDEYVDGKTIFFCQKHSVDRDRIDQMVNEHIVALNFSMLNDDDTPVGDNCKGYPVLKVLPQGYDIKP